MSQRDYCARLESKLERNRLGGEQNVEKILVEQVFSVFRSRKSFRYQRHLESH